MLRLTGTPLASVVKIAPESGVMGGAADAGIAEAKAAAAAKPRVRSLRYMGSPKRLVMAVAHAASRRAPAGRDHPVPPTTLRRSRQPRPHSNVTDPRAP